MKLYLAILNDLKHATSVCPTAAFLVVLTVWSVLSFLPGWGVGSTWRLTSTVYGDTHRTGVTCTFTCSHT